MIPRVVFLSLWLVVGTIGWAKSLRPSATLPDLVACEGEYPGHLQGVCADEAGALYWSWTTDLVKTDAQGKILQQVPVAFHHGDLCYRDGRIYVAVNLGKFNEPPGQEDSWVYEYDAATLREVARHPVPELVHGAGGIAWDGARFMVVGGLPRGTNENYLYEYDASFRFRARHVLASGYTIKGIQTVAFAEGAWWFATYGDTRYFMRADESLVLTNKWEFDASLGILPYEGGAFWIGTNETLANGKHRGQLTRYQFDAARGLVPFARRP